MEKVGSGINILDPQHWFLPSPALTQNRRLSKYKECGDPVSDRDEETARLGRELSGLSSKTRGELDMLKTCLMQILRKA
jgi:hypothetical protein